MKAKNVEKIQRTVAEICEAEAVRDISEGRESLEKIHIPHHLLPALVEIAKRQRTTLQVVCAQALSDYVYGGI